MKDFKKIKTIRIKGVGEISRTKYLNALRRGEELTPYKSAEIDARAVKSYYIENYKVPKKQKISIQNELYSREFEQEEETIEDFERETQSTRKIIQADPITYNKEELKRLRKRVRNSKGQFYDAEYYKKLSIISEGKTDKELDAILKGFQSKRGNKDVEIFTETKDAIAFFQASSMLDNLADGRVYKKNENKHKERSKFRFGSYNKIKIIGLDGDSYHGRDTENIGSLGEANLILIEQNKLIDRVMDIIDPKIKGKRGASFQVVIPTKQVTSSKNKITHLEYDYSKAYVAGGRDDKNKRGNFWQVMNMLLNDR